MFCQVVHKGACQSPSPQPSQSQSRQSRSPSQSPKPNLLLHPHPSTSLIPPKPVYGAEVQPTEESIYVTAEEAELRTAIQALAPILSDVDRVKYAKYINPPVKKSVSQRLQNWRSSAN